MSQLLEFSIIIKCLLICINYIYSKIPLLRPPFGLSKTKSGLSSDVVLVLNMINMKIPFGTGKDKS